MTFWALSLAVNYGANIPAYDEWEIMLPYYTGHKPVTFSWLWEQCYDYRMPLPKLILLASFKFTGGNFKAPIILNVLILSCAALILIGAARRTRGKTLITDAIFPVLLLNIGQFETLLLNYTVIYTLYAFVLCFLLRIVSGFVGIPDATYLFAASALIFILPLCGSPGMAASPPLIAWLLIMGLLMRRPHQSSDRTVANIIIFNALAISAVVFLYIYHYRTHPSTPFNSDLSSVLRTTAEFLSISVGNLGIIAWPGSALVMFLAGFLAVLYLIRNWRQNPENRIRVVGMLAVIVAMAIHAITLGFARAGLGEGAGFCSRYMTMAAPIACAIYLIFSMQARGRWHDVARISLFLAAIASLPFGRKAALQLAVPRKLVLSEAENHMRVGMHPDEIAIRYWPHLSYSEADVAYGCAMLAEARVGPFADTRVLESPGQSHAPRIIAVSASGGVAKIQHSSAIRSLAFSPAGNALATADDEGILCIWELPSGRLNATLECHESPITFISFLPEGSMVTAGWDGSIKIWNRISLEIIMHVRTPGIIAAAAIASDAEFLATSDAIGTVTVRRLTDGIVEYIRPTYHGQACLDLPAADRPTLIAGPGLNPIIHIWELRRDQPSHKFAGHKGIITALASTVDGKTLISGSWDSTAMLWDLHTGAHIKTLIGHTDSILAAAISPNGKLAITTSLDGTAIVWNLEDFSQAAVLRHHDEPVTCAAFSPGNDLLAIGGRDRTVHILRVSEILAGSKI